MNSLEQAYKQAEKKIEGQKVYIAFLKARIERQNKCIDALSNVIETYGKLLGKKS